MSLLHRTHHDDRTDDITVEHRPDEVHEADSRDVPAAAARHDESVTRERTWTFAPGQIISLIVGIGAIAMGVVALVRAGIDGSFATPVVDVLGFSHTAWLGLAEVGLGILLVLAGTGAWGRPLSVVLGAGMMISGVLIGAETSAMPEELGLEEDYGWMLVLFGALVALAAMVLPVWRSRRTWRDGRAIDDPVDRPTTQHTH
jgi:hypothetical protein